MGVSNETSYGVMKFAQLAECAPTPPAALPLFPRNPSRGPPHACVRFVSSGH